MPPTGLERINKVGDKFEHGFTIDASVGDWAKGAVNAPRDVETVQLMLEHVAKKAGRKELHPGGVDGRIARAPGRSGTVKAIVAYQRSFMNAADGVVEPKGKTIERLRSEIQGTRPRADAARSVMKTQQAGDGKPSWLSMLGALSPFGLLALLSKPDTGPEWVSIAEDEVGTKEVKGKKHNPRILEYHKTTGTTETDENPWCASFVNWALKQSGHEGAGSAWSHAWKSWGDGVAKPALGAVAFIDWGKVDPKKKGKGHVGFVVGKTAKGRIVLLGGNQSNSVSYAGFKPSAIVGYRFPKGYAVDAKLFDLPVMEISKGGGGFGATR